MMSEEDEEILFDRSGVIITDEEYLLSDQDGSGFNDSPVSGSPVLVRDHASPQVRGRVFQTICLCAAFFGLGLCIAIPGPTLLDLQEQTNTDTEQISRLFTGRSIGYVFGSLIGGLLFDRVNQTCLLSLSLLLTAIGTAAAPWCTNFLFLIGILAFQGISMGFLDTGGNVLCLYIWGRGSSPYMQAMHFVFGLGAFVAPLLAEPFLSRSNSTNITVFDNVSYEFGVSSLNIAALHTRHLLAVEDERSISPLPPAFINATTTVNPKFKKPDSADGKFLSQDPVVADGRKYGRLNYENEKSKKKNPFIGVSVVDGIPVPDNSTNNDTMVPDTGQTTETATTTAAPTTTVASTTSAPVVKAGFVTVDWMNLTLSDNDSDSNETSSKDSTLDIIKHKFKQVARTVTAVFSSFTKVQFAYLVIAAFVLMVSVMFMFHCCCCGRCKCDAVKYQDSSVNYKIKKESPGFRVQILILLFAFYFFYVGMEVTYGGLVMSFAVNYLKWSKSSGTLVNSVFWGSFAAGRLLAIPLSKCLTPAVMIVADLVLTIFALAGLVIMLNTNHIMLWFCTATLGIGLASIFPTGITWAERYMQVTGKSTAVFVVGSALGEMLLPLITGFLFQNKGPMWLMYVMMGCAFLAMITYIIMQNLATNMGERYEPVPRRKLRRINGNSTVIQLHSINSDDDDEDDEEDDLDEADSVPLIGGSEDLQRRHKKVRFNLRNGSARNHSSNTSIANGSKASILKSRTETKGE